ncbi:putative oxidoreductase [Martiniozyma asiatica (nom. inval.)]|nr:putative oxidoreductase [Martiniozyma asiatica]
MMANPDGIFERPIIGFNNSWPLPTIEVNRGDRVQLFLTNGLADATTSLHFHGLFQKGSNNMDGPVGVTQCPISPGETMLYDFVVDQVGTYWYHSHSGSQYSDGLRGLFIVHDTKYESNYQFDKELTWSISDWYHDSSTELIKQQLTRYNPTGAEPVPQNALFNDSRNVTVPVEKDTTYLIRIANIGIMVSQYVYIQGHDFEIIEIDGVYTKPQKANMVYLTVGQRVSILVKTQSNPTTNFNILNIIDKSMLDTVPDDLQLYGVNTLSYDASFKSLSVPKWIDNQDKFEPFDDFLLEPFYSKPLLPEPDHRIDLTLYMKNLGDGINYAFFNNHTYVAPRVPTLLTALSAPEHLKNNGQIYGSNTNSFVLQKDDIIEIVLNNEDDNKHPMHLHGHQFQVVARSEDFDEPVHYDPRNVTLPENPAIRDTVYVEGNGYVVLRFKADNPGIWFFHCHLDFHLEQGLAVTLVEAPSDINIRLSKNEIDICHIAGVPVEGNAAGNMDFLDLAGEPVQPNPLPDGFTSKGYFALTICTLVALYGLSTIYSYGMKDVTNTEKEKILNEKIVVKNLILSFEKQSSPEYQNLLKDLKKLDNLFDQL